MQKILLYGYGNPGRQDDGLGIKLINALEQWAKENKMTNIDTDSNYQLNIEDADNISGYDMVIFADATVEDNVEDFLLSKVEPSADVTFTMHSVSPAFVLDLCKKLYQKTPETYLVHLKGYEWEMTEVLTPQAQTNLNKALQFMKQQLKHPQTLYRYVSETVAPE